MTSPVIVVLASGSHLAERNAARTLCGESVSRPLGLFPVEPGSDFGEGRNDCPKCARGGK